MLHQFVGDLRRRPPLERPPSEMGALLSQLAASADALPPLVQRPGDYTRTLAYGDDRFEVLLLDWAPGSTSAIHDHGGRHCWFVVLDGSVRVDDFKRIDGGDIPGRAMIEARSAAELRRGQLDLRSGPFDIHQVRAIDRAVTLHVYSRPLDEFLIYDPASYSCRSVSSDYDRALGLFSASSNA